MGNIVKGNDGSNSKYAATEEEDDAEAFAPESEAREFPWLRGSEERPRMKLAIIKAEIPAFFHEGYAVDPDKTNDLLYKAIMKQQEDEVKQLLARQSAAAAGGVDVNEEALSCVPYTPLHVACESGNVNIVTMIKNAGANVNYMSQGYSPLVTASRHGHGDIVTYLLEQGAFIDQKAGKEIIPRFIKNHFANDLVFSDSVWTSKQQVCQVVNELSDPYWGNTALIQACREHNEEIVQQLIHRKCKTDVQNLAGNTALHVSCLSRTANTHTTVSSLYVPATLIIGGNRTIVRMLLDAGTDPDIRNDVGETPLERSFRVLKENDPLSMYDWGFSTNDKLEIIRRLMHVLRELLIGGCDVRGNLREMNNDLDSIFWTVSNLVKICQTLNELDKENSLQCLYQDTLLLFYECVYISEKFFTWDDLETVILSEQDMDEEFRQKLLSINYRDFSLAKWCRIVIRQSLRKPVRKNVPTLSIPNHIKQYILFSDLDY